MKKLLITTAVGLCLAAPAFAQTAADQKGLVTVNLQDVLNNLSADLKVDRANIPVTAQIPINAAANVCGVSVNVLSAQASGGGANCTAKTGSQDLTQAVQQQMAAGGQTGNQSGTTAAVNQAAPSSATAPSSTSAPANSAAAPAPAGNAQTAQTQPNAQPLNAQQPNVQTPSTQTPAPTAQQQPAASTAQQQPAASSAARQQPAASTAQQQPAASSAAQQQPAASSTAQQQPAASNAQQQPATSAASQPATSAQQPAQNAQAPAQQNSRAAQGSSAAPAAQQTAANDPQLQVKISEALGPNIKPVDVSFSITQGAAVPASVSVRPLPDKVLTIAPQYKGYSYFATKEKIVIVEPSKHTVVAVLPMATSSRAAAPASTKQTVKFSKEQQDVIRKRVVTTKKPSTTGSSSTRLSVEQRVPDSVQLEEFSDEVVREVPTVKSYRYYRQDDGLAVIDPGERRVIEIIR
jgi:hypothetical protein